MTYDEAISKMWSLADKPERMRLFHKIVFDLGIDDGEQFWLQFWAIWMTSENLNEDFDFFPALIERGLQLGDSKSPMGDKEKGAFDALPDPITIYRGGVVDLNEEGWSWTTDRSKARWFAERAYGDCERIVKRALVRKADVLAYLLGRGESEIVVNPDRVINAVTDEVFETKTKGNALFYAAQSGKLDEFMGGSDLDRVRAEMMVSTIRGELQPHIDQIEAALAFVRWADLRSKRGYMEAMLDLLKKKQADPDYVPVAGFSM